MNFCPPSLSAAAEFRASETGAPPTNSAWTISNFQHLHVFKNNCPDLTMPYFLILFLKKYFKEQARLALPYYLVCSKIILCSGFWNLIEYAK